MSAGAGGLRRRTRASRSSIRSALVLAWLLAASTPMGLIANPASGQASVPQPSPDDANPIRFDHEPADYLEGEKVIITFTGDVNPAAFDVRIRCRECPDKDKTYRASANAPITFPDDFGAEARAERQPRWNDTWVVELVSGAQVIHRREFRVWVLDAYRFPGNEPYPTGTLNFVATGFEPGGLVQFNVRHRRADGSFENVFVADVPASRDGRATYFWVIDKTEASRLTCPPRPTGYCYLYEVVVSGPGKEQERVRFRVVPAHLRWLVADGDGALGVPATLPRTENVTVDIDLRYPNNHVVTPFHLVSSQNPEGTLEVQVEAYEGENGYEEPRILANISATYLEGYLWRANWSIPRDTEIRVDRQYRFALVEQKDRYGNVIDYGPLNNFTVTPALLAPEFVDVPRTVERLDEAKVIVALRYHDDSPLRPGDNATPLRGCFFPETTGIASCSNGGFMAKAEYWEDGLWNFTYRFPRDYPDLAEHRFLFEGNPSYHEDRWNNRFRDAGTDPVIRVIPAKPRIELETTVQGLDRNATRGFDRGDRVAISAKITYPDGSPFTPAVNADESDQIAVELLKITRSGALAGETVVNLTSAVPSGPHWQGTYVVPKDASLAPAGPWVLRFDVQDNVTTPNRNVTRFLREVNPTLIKVIPTEQPPVKAAIGTTVHYKFRLVYADGTSVKANDVGSDLSVQVVRTTGRFAGAAVSGTLLPTYDPGRDEWRVEWEVPRQLFQGTFAFRPRGFDRHDNKVDPDASSRPFSTFTDSTRRVTLYEPATQVERGEAAVVVFDGRDGDVSLAGFPDTFPAIELQRYDATTEQWVTERRNTRVPGEGDGDHVARYNTTIATTLGVYRFALRGRDATFNMINGTSQEFTIVPTNVTRALFVPPPERVGKGQFIEWTLEREAGDSVTRTDVLFEGRPIRASNLLGSPLTIAGPIFSTGADRFNFSWRVPYAMESGTYSFTIEGRDAYQNRVLVEVPPVKAEPSVLTGQVIGNPERVQRRGAPITTLFAITYPNGDFFIPQGRPSVVVMNASGVVDSANVTYTGLVYEATWTPPMTASLDEYWFEVGGQDATGNVFPALRSSGFQLEPGTATRDFVRQPALTVRRLDETRVEVPKTPDDVFIAFTLGYVSDAAQITDSLVKNREATPVASLEHDVDESRGQYIVRWSPERDEKPGIYTIEFSGIDTQGNEFRGRSEPFSVVPTDLIPTPDTVSDDEFGPGKRVTFTFDLAYALSRTIPADDRVAIPDAFIMYNGDPIRPRPQVSYDPDTRKWRAEWDAPDVLPDGMYALVVQGTDDSGNQILGRMSQTIPHENSVASSFLTTVLGVPDPGALGAALALLVAAGVAGLRKGRRDE